MAKTFPVIDLAATGENIIRLSKDRGMTVRDLRPEDSNTEIAGRYIPQRTVLTAVSFLSGNPVGGICASLIHLAYPMYCPASMQTVRPISCRCWNNDAPLPIGCILQ